MKKRMTRHAAPLCALLCVMILVSVFISIRVSVDAGNYEIRDIEGNTSFLDDVTARMVLQDSTHKQYLTLSNGEIGHTYEYIMPIKERRDESVDYSQQFVEHEDADVLVTSETNLEDTSDAYDIYVTQLKRAADKVRVSVLLGKVKHYPSSDKVKTVQVITDVTAEDSNHPFVFNYLQDIEHYKKSEGDAIKDQTDIRPFEDIGMKVTNKKYTEESWRNTPLHAEDDHGTMYFTPALQPFHGGQSAIYRVNAWNTGDVSTEPVEKDGAEYTPAYAEIPLGSVTEIVTFAVDDLRTVKLDIVDDRLCLLLAVDGMLTLRVYNMDGVLEHELPLFDYDADSTAKSELYTNESGSSTMLCYQLSQSLGENTDEDLNNINEYLFCVELNETAQLKSVITPPQLLLRAAYIKNRWILIETKPDAQDVQHPAYAPLRYYISALDNKGQRLYLGEIKTDAWEDEIQYYMAQDDEWSKHNTYYIDKRMLTCDILTEEQ